MSQTYYSSAWTGIVTVEEKIDLVPGFKEWWELLMFFKSPQWDTGVIKESQERPRFEFNKLPCMNRVKNDG